MYLHLLIFRDNLFDFNQSFMKANSLFIIASMSPLLISFLTISIVVERVVSS